MADEIFWARFAEPRALKWEWIRAWVEVGFRHACDACGVGQFQPYAWERTDPAFKEARAIADAVLADRLEDRLRALADGTDNASAAQMTALGLRLRTLRPDRYGERQRLEVTGAGGGAVRIEDGSASRAVEMLARYAAAARAERGLPALPAPEGEA
jgi:hypothetical protein